MKKAMTFEQSLDRLEEIVASLDDERLPLEDAMKLFTEGLALSKSCGKTLDEAKLRLERLSPREETEENEESGPGPGTEQ